MKSLAFAALLSAASAVNAPVWPRQYSVSGIISLPYGNITEPYSANVDNGNGRERLEYYGGLDVYVYSVPANATYQLNPVIQSWDCFLTEGTPSIAQVLPDLSGYTFQGRTYYNGKSVYNFELKVQDLARVSTYNMYISTVDGVTPVAFHMLGYDSLFGSHFDEYIVTYETYYPGADAFPPNAFSPPSKSCGGFPTGSSMGRRGGEVFMELIPQSKDAYMPATPKGDKAFVDFVNQYGKVYASDKELHERHAIFTRNRRVIANTNQKKSAEGKSLRLAMNFLGDATPLELSMRRGRVSRRKEGESNGAHAVHDAPAAARVASLPTAVDWRTVGAVTQVADQGICGSCWSHGAAQMLEGQRFLKYGVLEVLSKQELMDCSWNFGNDACDGGEDFQAYQWIMQNGGLSTKAVYGPYLQADGFCHAYNNATGSHLPVALSLSSYVNVTSGSLDAMLDAVANVGPISISVDANVDTFTFYSEGVLDDPNCLSAPADLDHTILAVGYATEPTTGQQYWIVKNSWSEHWGNGGYINIATANNICGVYTAATYAILN